MQTEFKTYNYPEKPKPGLYWWTGSLNNMKPVLSRFDGKNWWNLESDEKSILNQGWGGWWAKFDIESIRPSCPKE